MPYYSFFDTVLRRPQLHFKQNLLLCRSLLWLTSIIAFVNLVFEIILFKKSYVQLQQTSDLLDQLLSSKTFAFLMSFAKTEVASFVVFQILTKI